MTRLGVMVVLALAATGCGSDGGGDPSGAATPPAATSTSGDAEPAPENDSGDQVGGASVDPSGNVAAPCSVLTEQAVADATGLVVTGSEDRGRAEGCRWYVERVDPDILADDAITWQPFRAEQFGAQKEALDQGLEGEAIDGLGNDALFIGPATFGEVWVLLDDLSFRVGNQFAFGNFDGRPVQEALARALADALG